MQFVRAVFCCTCCNSADSDDEYQSAFTGLVNDHFKHEKELLAKKRQNELSVTTLANVSQINYRRTKLSKQVKAQWVKF